MNSFVEPDIAFKLLPNSIENAPFVLSTVFQKSAHELRTLIQFPNMFNSVDLFIHIPQWVPETDRNWQNDDKLLSISTKVFNNFICGNKTETPFDK